MSKFIPTKNWSRPKGSVSKRLKIVKSKKKTFVSRAKAQRINKG
jgi:hypothetical protein